MEAEQRGQGSSFDTTRHATTLEVRPMTAFKYNSFCAVFSMIRANLRARRLAEKYGHPTEKSLGSTTTEEYENKPERGSEQLLHRLMDGILLFFAEETCGEDWLRR